MNACDPTTIDPTGADSPFDRQNITESNGSTTSATGTPSASAALNTRAPSRCTGRPISCAPAAISRDASSDSTVPPAMLCEFSSAISPVRELFTDTSRTAARTSSHASRPPSRPGTARGITPDSTAIAAIS